MNEKGGRWRNKQRKKIDLLLLVNLIPLTEKKIFNQYNSVQEETKEKKLIFVHVRHLFFKKKEIAHIKTIKIRIFFLLLVLLAGQSVTI